MRFHDWDSKLYETIERNRNRGYKLGEHDCVLFAINIIKEICGIDYGERIRGKYNNKIGYLRLWKEIGGSSLQEITEIIIGQVGRGVKEAQRGDLVLCKDKEDHLGICIGSNVVTVLIDAKGLGFTDLLDCSCCWRIE